MFVSGSVKSCLRTIQGTKCIWRERPSPFFPGASLTVPQSIAHQGSFFWLFWPPLPSVVRNPFFLVNRSNDWVSASLHLHSFSWVSFIFFSYQFPNWSAAVELEVDPSQREADKLPLDVGIKNWSWHVHVCVVARFGSNYTHLAERYSFPWLLLLWV